MLKKLWTDFICLVVRGFVSLRYRIKVTGLEKLNLANLPKKGGILFLPNHPAEIDPVIMSLIFWPKYQVHPIVVEEWYYAKGIHYPMKLVEAVPLPDFNGAVNKWKQKKITKAFAFHR